ncbi:hypothetical protein PENSPDRAFT_657570 [Peniophora sp. CONT]|nr:hypothetical protein PENSPDRAFT_657570 [Peniophora sp. CONT]
MSLRGDPSLIPQHDYNVESSEHSVDDEELCLDEIHEFAALVYYGPGEGKEFMLETVKLEDALRAAGAMDLVLGESPGGQRSQWKRYTMKMTSAQRIAFYDGCAEYVGTVFIDKLNRSEDCMHDGAMPIGLAERPLNTPRDYEARLSPRAKVGDEALEKLGAALRAAGAVDVVRLASPHRGYTLRMSPVQREAFFDGYRNRRMVSVSRFGV